jgi:signal transduction histidine kinase
MSERLLLCAEIRVEADVVAVRQHAWHLAGLLGFDGQDQTRLATAVSEIARNAFQYAGGGRAEFAVGPDGEPQPLLLIRIADDGPGIADPARILDGRYDSPTGMGVGVAGARRLVDTFALESAPGAGTRVTLGKRLPTRVLPLTAERLESASRALAAAGPRDTLAELRAQNRELLRTLAELQARQAEIERLNAELAETNRGVLALYAELDDRAVELSRASQLKSRFLSNISHELRTPLNSILNLTRLLLDRLDGDLSAEQERQVTMIRTAAGSLLDIVNDLLDLERIEAGKTVLRLGEFAIDDALAALRGMLRPLVTSERVTLTVEASPEAGTMYSDEGKVSQILRNLVSNAIKFTESGEIRVVAAPRGKETVVFQVTDTGIGIAREDQERIFEEFGQVDGPMQRRMAGCGLGLPLSRRLAHLLGGSLTVESRFGAGSTFTLELPRRFGASSQPAAATVTAAEVFHA